MKTTEMVPMPAMTNNAIAPHDQPTPAPRDPGSALEISSSAAPAVPAVGAIEVEDRSGTLTVYATTGQLRDAILCGRARRNDAARKIVAAKAANLKAAHWTTVEALAVADPLLRSLYRPIWARALKYAPYGALAGISIKAIDTTVALFAVNQVAAMLWLATVGSLFLTRKWPFAPAIPLLIALNTMPRVNFFMIFLGAAAVGAFFGALLGLIAGALVGYSLPDDTPMAPDATPESARTVWLGLAIPAILLIVAGGAYAWVHIKLASGDLGF